MPRLDRITLFLALFLPITVTLAAEAASGGVNAPEHLDKPYVILISIDGFGADARERADTPALDRLAESGVVAESMQPAWPSLTFPNHYSIATGLYPSQHGIVGNNFPSSDRQGWYSLRDRTQVENADWYSGEPIWVSAEKAGMVAASYFFVGTEAYVQGIRPTYSYLFDVKAPGMARVDRVLEWLALPAEKRPHMISLYFQYVDDESHRYGPDAEETRDTITRVDGYIGKLLEGIDELPFRDQVYVIVVSDHGQSLYFEPDDPYVLNEHVDIRDARVVQGGNYVMLYYDSPDERHIAVLVGMINRTWRHGKAYARKDAPEHWRTTDDGRYPDVFIQADEGHAVMTEPGRWLSTGAHGWPPEADSMAATFIAAGPGLPSGHRVGRISVVDVYPLMIDILGLELPDGYVVQQSELIGILEPQTERTAQADTTPEVEQDSDTASSKSGQ